MKKAIIIGATSGIGKALSEILIQNNYVVGITGRRKENLDDLKKSHPKQVVVSSFDCTTANNPLELNALVKKLGSLDLLVFCSGYGKINHTLDFTIENDTNKINVLAFTNIAVWSYNYFKKQQHGQLVTISSIAGIRGGRHSTAYNASKAYQINYFEGLRQKAKKENLSITITDIRPGFVDTAMAQGNDKFWVASKEKAAHQIFKIILKRKNIGYVTKRWFLIAILLKLMPNWLYKKF